MKKRKIISLCIILAILSSLMTLISLPALAEGSEVSMSLDYGESWVGFATLDDFLYAVSEGEYAGEDNYYVKLLSDITVAETIVIPTGTFEIYFDGHTITPSPSMTEGAVMSFVGDAYVYLNGLYDSWGSETGGIDAGALTAISVGGELGGSYGSPNVYVGGVEVSGATAIELKKTDSYGGACIDIADGAIVKSTVTSAIVSDNEAQEDLPTLNIRSCELIAPDGVAEVDVNAPFIIDENPASDITVRLDGAPTVLENASGYSCVRYIAKSDTAFSGYSLPYGYYVTKDGTTRVSFDSDDILSVAAGEEYFIDRLEDYYYVYATNWGVDTVERVMPDESIPLRYTEKGGATVKIKVVPYTENTVGDIVITLKNSLGDDLAFTRTVVDYEGTEVIEVTFTMPEDTVELTAEPVGTTYTVTKVTPEAGGDFEVDRTEAAEGEIVAVTLSPEAGYVMSRIYVIDGESKNDLFAFSYYHYASAEKSSVILPDTYYFYMPPSDIEISVEYVRGAIVYFRAPNTETWSAAARAIYRESETASHYYNAASDTVDVEGDELHQYLIPEEALDFFVQNYMVGMPSHLIPTGPTWSKWYDIEANKVYEFELAASDPYEDLVPEGSEGGEGGSTPEPTPPPEGGGDDDPEQEGGTPIPAPDGGTGGGEGAATPEPTPTPPATGGEGSGGATTPDTDKTPEGDTKPAPDNGKDGEIEMASPEVIKIATIIAIAVCVFLYAYLLIKDANYKDIFNIFRD